MAEIKGLMSLLNKLETRLKQSAEDKNKSVVVGYTQSYGIYVHENLQAKHPVGQAKFLEQPARQLREVLGNLVIVTVKKGGSLLQGQLIAGLRLQRESQKLCPVDTGALRASSFTKVEDSQDTPTGTLPDTTL